MFVVWFQNHSAHNFHLSGLAPSGIVSLAAHLLVGANADVVGLTLAQLGADCAGAVGALEGNGFAIGELLTGAVLELIAADAAVLLPPHSLYHRLFVQRFPLAHEVRRLLPALV